MRPILTIPRIDTERLILRAPETRDLDSVAAFYRSPRSFYVGGPKSRFEAWRVMCSILGHWALRGYGFWMIERRDNGQTAGATGILNHEGWDEPELGWHIYDGHEGQGIAFEAATAARAYASRHFAIPAPISYIDPDNSRSVALALRLGAVFEREGALFANPCHVYRHPETEHA